MMWKGGVVYAQNLSKSDAGANMDKMHWWNSQMFRSNAFRTRLLAL